MDVKLFSTIIYALSCFVIIYALVYLGYNLYKQSKFRKNSIRKFRKHLARRVFKQYPQIEDVLENTLDALNSVLDICEYPLSNLFIQENIIRSNLYKGTPEERENMRKELNEITFKINEKFPEYISLVEKAKELLRDFYKMTCNDSTTILDKKSIKLWKKSGYADLVATLYDYYIELHYNLTAHQDSGFEFIDHIMLEW